MCSWGIFEHESLVRLSNDENQRIAACHHLPGNPDFGLLGSEAVRADLLTNSLDRYTIGWRQPENDGPLVQTDLHFGNAVDLLHGHAHGVGTYRSVHAEDCLAHFTELSACRVGRQGECQADC